MSENYNIPSITTAMVVEKLTAMYIKYYQKNKLGTVPSVCLWGPMGVGKSMAVFEIAENLSKELGYEVGVTDIRLGNFSPIDLRGIPSADAKKEFTVWLKPKIFDFDKEKVHILFLDEISSVPQSVQAAAYQIVLDKQIGEFSFPENCIMICAGNRTTDRSIAFKMSKALANRLRHFEVRADYDGWKNWAVKNGIHEMVLGYLAFDNSSLNKEPDLEELAFPTPRSWEFVSNTLEVMEEEPRQIHELIAGCVGVTTALAFEAWCDIYKTLPAVEDIFSGRCRTAVKTHDALYALISSMITYVGQHKNNLKVSELENGCRYAAAFPADFGAMFFRSIVSFEDINLLLLKCPSFNTWMKKNKRFL